MAAPLVTRNRTLEFHKFRQARGGMKGRGVGFNDDIPLVATSVDIPPHWVDLTESVKDMLSEIKRKMQQLKQLHQKHLLPGFSDKMDDEHTIEILTGEVSRMFSQAQNKIKGLSAPGLANSAEQAKVTKNIQSSLALQLQEISQHFKRDQQMYMAQLKGGEQRAKEFGKGLDYEQRREVEAFPDRGFTTRQQELTMESDRVIEERSEAVEKIGQSIYELAEIFKDLNVLVIEQGTILDSIEYNINQTVSYTKKAHIELTKANKSQKSYRTKLCILLLVVMILALSVVLVVGK